MERKKPTSPTRAQNGQMSDKKGEKSTNLREGEARDDEEKEAFTTFLFGKVCIKARCSSRQKSSKEEEEEEEEEDNSKERSF